MNDPESKAAAAPRRRIFLMRHGSETYFDDGRRPHLPA